ncbi:YcxB family protein [Parasediminibacterium sp. JCM 36343]|uniref:YcxB family protein n=1 Tax=Parasediminibacterium sp. JCM 36343 TaxID=3374279 RepID=UPI00397C4190
MIQFSFSYDKNKTIQALRYHFFSRKEIKVMIVVVNVFAIVAAVLFYSKMIRPEPFLLGSFIWVTLMLSIWYILPYSIYRKSSTFKEKFNITIGSIDVKIDNEQGRIAWPWAAFTKYFESPHFFHLYFDEKSFFLIPKDSMTEEMKHDFRGVLKEMIG